MESKETLDITTLIILGSLGMLTLVSFIIVFVLLYQKKMLSHKALLQQSETEYQKQLLNASIDVAEEERRKVATNIHDDVGLILNVLKLNFTKMKRNLNDKTLVMDLIDNNFQILEEASSTLRGITHELMPPSLSILGLQKGLKEMCRQINGSGKINIDISPPELRINLDKKKELQLYRLIKELVNNIIKNANATHIHINSSLDANMLSTIIEHNGTGITNEEVDKLIHSQKGIGLKSIQSRVQLTNSQLNYYYIPKQKAQITIQTPVL